MPKIPLSQAALAMNVKRLGERNTLATFARVVLKSQNFGKLPFSNGSKGFNDLALIIETK